MLPYTIPKLKHVDVNGRFFLLAGPCAIESKEMAMEIAERIKGISDKYHIPFIFKGSYRKANRTSLTSFTGIGDEKALDILAQIGERFDIPTVTDIMKAMRLRWQRIMWMYCRFRPFFLGKPIY